MDKAFTIYDITPLPPEQVLEQLAMAHKEAEIDAEPAHIRADNALCGLLLNLGFVDIVEQFVKLPKWYA